MNWNNLERPLKFIYSTLYIYIAKFDSALNLLIIENNKTFKTIKSTISSTKYRK